MKSEGLNNHSRNKNFSHESAALAKINENHWKQSKSRITQRREKRKQYFAIMPRVIIKMLAWVGDRRMTELKTTAHD